MRQYRSPAERSVELEPRGGFSALREACLAEVVRWRAYRGGNYLHRPEPLVTELLRDQYARWMGDELDASRDDGLPDDAVRVGFDDHGRPVIARAIEIFPGQGKHQLLRYCEGYEEVVHTEWEGTRTVCVLHLWRDDAGRVVETRDQAETVWTYRYDERGRLAVATEAFASGTRWGLVLRGDS
jgi:YD repeat-containing protein